MCKAIVKEMHIEVDKHGMTKKGFGAESHVWETSNAMCLGLLQKYKLDMVGEKLEKKSEDEEEDMGMGMAGVDPQLAMRGMLVLKMGCSRWLEDYGGDTSGFIFKSVRDKLHTPQEAAKEFCNDVANQCGKMKKEKKKQAKEKDKQREKERRELRKKEDAVEEKRKEDDPFSKLPKDSMAGLQRMLEMAKDDPLHYMEDDEKARIQKGAKDLQCDVCRVALQQVHDEVQQRPKSMRAESDILLSLDSACQGGKDLSVPSYFGVEPPPLPPLWTDKHRPKLDKNLNRYTLKRFPKKAAKLRRKWRELTPSGQHKPPPQDEYSGDMMMSMSCKEVIEPGSMSEVLYDQMSVCARSKDASCDAALATARLACKTVDDVPCVYEESKTEQPKKADEL